MMRYLLTLLLSLSLALPVFAQQETRSSKKGSSTPLPITGTSIDANHNGLDVNVVGGAAGGGTQYNQGTPTTDTDTLTMMGCVRSDTAAVATGVIDQDRARCIVDSTGRLWSHIGTIDGGTITTITNAVTVTDGAGALNVIVDSLPTVTVTDGAGALNVIVDSGTLGAVTSITNPVTVTDGSGALNVIVDSGFKDSRGLDLGTQLNPLVVSFPSYQATSVNPGKMPTLPQSHKIVGPLGQAIGANGDRLKVDPTPNPDACAVNRKTDVSISQTATTKLVTGRPNVSIYVCLLRVVAAAAEIVSEWEGTGTNCGTGTIAHSGSTTTANGESLAANGGFLSGNGASSVASLGQNTDFCLAQNGTSRVSGKLSYVYGP
jgi:hypothetical protein